MTHDQTVLVVNVETPPADTPDVLESVYAIDHLAAAGHGERRDELGRALREGRLRVLRDDSTVAGYSVMAPWWFGAAFRQLVYVGQEHRRSGLGHLLLEDIEHLCRQPIFTSTNQTNQPMRRLLETRHWLQCGYLEGLDEDDPSSSTGSNPVRPKAEPSAEQIRGWLGDVESPVPVTVPSTAYPAVPAAGLQRWRSTGTGDWERKLLAGGPWMLRGDGCG